MWELAKSGVPKSVGKKPTTRKRSRKVLPQVKTISKPIRVAQSCGDSTSPPNKRKETSSAEDHDNVSLHQHGDLQLDMVLV